MNDIWRHCKKKLLYWACLRGKIQGKKFQKEIHNSVSECPAKKLESKYVHGDRLRERVGTPISQNTFYWHAFQMRNQFLYFNVCISIHRNWNKMSLIVWGVSRYIKKTKDNIFAQKRAKQWIVWCNKSHTVCENIILKIVGTFVEIVGNSGNFQKFW